MTPPKKRGPKPNTGGRPKGSGALGHVRLACWVSPETRAALGLKPGAALDALIRSLRK